MGWVGEVCYPCRERLDPNLFRFQSKVWLDMQRGCMSNKPDVQETIIGFLGIVLTTC